MWSTPPILVVHLKRFQYQKPDKWGLGGGIRGKINELVQFPVKGLDLSRFVLGPQRPALSEPVSRSVAQTGPGGHKAAASSSSSGSSSVIVPNGSSLVALAAPHVPSSSSSTSSLMLLRPPSTEGASADSQIMPIETIDTESSSQSQMLVENEQEAEEASSCCSSAASAPAAAAAPVPSTSAPSVAPIYDLFAVSHHMGSMGGGHYVAMAQNWMDGEWLKFDDSWCSHASGSDTVSNSAYVLFYRRVEPATGYNNNSSSSSSSAPSLSGGHAPSQPVLVSAGSSMSPPLISSSSSSSPLDAFLHSGSSRNGRSNGVSPNQFLPLGGNDDDDGMGINCDPMVGHDDGREENGYNEDDNPYSRES